MQCRERTRAPTRFGRLPLTRSLDAGMVRMQGRSSCSWTNMVTGDDRSYNCGWTQASVPHFLQESSRQYVSHEFIIDESNYDLSCGSCTRLIRTSTRNSYVVDPNILSAVLLKDSTVGGVGGRPGAGASGGPTAYGRGGGSGAAGGSPPCVQKFTH